MNDERQQRRSDVDVIQIKLYCMKSTLCMIKSQDCLLQKPDYDQKKRLLMTS